MQTNQVVARLLKTKLARPTTNDAYPRHHKSLTSTNNQRLTQLRFTINGTALSTGLTTAPRMMALECFIAAAG